jgi:predicted glycoside hydrolase/deacetylase ChbG (UPF0249 family)
MTLVVNADDLGISPGVTRGIIEAHRRGIVRSTSLVVTFASSPEAAATVRTEPDLEVGLHLDLVGGEPVSDPRTVRSLCDEDGRFHPLAEFTRRLFTGRIRVSELSTEVHAQAELARSWGLEPLAWDSHRHVHLMPPVALVVGRIARERGVRWIRRARPPRTWSGPKQAALRLGTFGSALAYRGIAGPSWYVDVTSERPRLDAAGLALLATYGGIGEVSCHPGYIDEELRRTGDALVDARSDDLKLVTDPLLRVAFGDDTVRWRVP